MAKAVLGFSYSEGSGVENIISNQKVISTADVHVTIEWEWIFSLFL